MIVNPNTLTLTPHAQDAAEALVQAQREAIVAIAPTATAEVLEAAVQLLSGYEAIARLAGRAARVYQARLRDGSTPDAARGETARYMAVQVLDAGADDTWSGRGNDRRRATHDAERAWVRALLETVVD